MAITPKRGRRTIKIELGLPKDGRWDLKRFVLGLACNPLGMPLFMKSFSGNESDRNSLVDMVKSLKKGLASSDRVYYVADRAFYTLENLRDVGGFNFYG